MNHCPRYTHPFDALTACVCVVYGNERKKGEGER